MIGTKLFDSEKEAFMTCEIMNLSGGELSSHTMVAVVAGAAAVLMLRAGGIPAFAI